MIVWQIIMEEWNYIDLPEIGTLMHRITLGNCSPPYSGGSGSVKTQSGCALCGFLLHHILPALVLLRKPLFGLAKRQLPRTLGDIRAKMIGHKTKKLV